MALTRWRRVRRRFANLRAAGGGCPSDCIDHAVIRSANSRTTYHRTTLVRYLSWRSFTSTCGKATALTRSRPGCQFRRDKSSGPRRPAGVGRCRLCELGGPADRGAGRTPPTAAARRLPVGVDVDERGDQMPISMPTKHDSSPTRHRRELSDHDSTLPPMLDPTVSMLAFTSRSAKWNSRRKSDGERATKPRSGRE